MERQRQEAESGDLKQIQRDHQLSEKRKSTSSSGSSVRPPSLLERRQSNNQNVMKSDEITPMPTGAERMAALRDLGATFEEGRKSIAKVATPTETVVPSFVDSDHLEQILHKKQKKNLSDTCDETKVN
ncbi:hypothetical protein EDC96DRAFT_530704 [Choanephora cucurbitarum]|nr:hypothetical protein EDC96DRAFT_530704 [Choanephora cucurbitarum]